MKRIYAFLCAVAIVLSASAMPQFQKIGAQKQLPKMENVLKAKATTPLMHKALNPLAKLPQAKDAAYDMEIVYMMSQYVAQYNAYVYVLVDSYEEQFYFGFASTGEDPVVNGQTYTLADMDANFSFLYMEGYSPMQYSAASFTKTVNEEGQVTIIASVTISSYVFNLTYDEASMPDAPQGGDFVADAAYKYTGYDSNKNYLIQYQLSDTANSLMFIYTFPAAVGQEDVVSGQTYTWEDMNENITYIVFNDYTYIELDSASFTKTVNDDESYTIVASAVDTLGQVWNVSFAQAAPALDTLELNGELKFYDSEMTGGLGNVVIVEAANADTSRYIGLCLLNTTAFTIEGDYVASDLYSRYTTVMLASEDTLYYLVNSADIHVAYDDMESVYHITGTLYTYNYEDASDIVKFTLNLTITGAAPEQWEPSDMTFQFQVTEESIIIIPSNETDPWDWWAVTQYQLDSLAGGNIDTLAAYCYNKWGDTYAAASEYELMFDELYELNYTEGEYILVVWGSHGGVTTDADSITFVLPKKPVIPSDMTFSFENTGEGIVVTPSNNTDPWDAMIIAADTLAMYFNNNIDTLAAYMYNYYGDQYASAGDYEFTFASLYNNNYEPGDYVLVVWGCDGGVTTPAASFAFTLFAEGIEDIKAAGKAVKVLRNGQLNIEKGNKVFNVFGAQLK